MTLRRHSSNAAYTLLELSLVLGVLSLLIAGALSIITQNVRRAARIEVNRKMDVIETALISFRRVNNRLPCPADGSLAITSHYFGIEGIPAGDCTNGSSYTNGSALASDGGTSVAPDASFSANGNVGGDVPVKTLGLSDDYMFDPWGGRFLYVVAQLDTPQGVFLTCALNALCGAYIGVTDDNGNSRTNPTALAVLMSYGPDGHGAFQLSGKRKATGNANINTLINCHCDGAALASTTHPFGGQNFIQASATSTSPTDPANFDDIVRFYTRSSFLSSADIMAPSR